MYILQADLQLLKCGMDVGIVELHLEYTAERVIKFQFEMWL
jgi:hypothetical protein